MEISPQMEHASTGDDNATKRKAPTAGLEGSATKMKGQYGCSNSMGEETAYEQEPSEKTAAGLSEVTVVADEMERDPLTLLKVLPRDVDEFGSFIAHPTAVGEIP
jgi:hypothetical protein